MLVFVYVLYVWLLKKYTADHWGRLIVTSLLVAPAELRGQHSLTSVERPSSEPEKVNTTLPHFP